jgi:CHRD domain-containing protein
MVLRRWRPAATAALLMAALLSFASAIPAQDAQTPETFRARLSPVPINISMMSTIAGTGSLTATLTGKQLTIQGTFEGLRSPATTAQIRRGPKGIRGPVIPNLDLMVTKAEKGTISGTLELTLQQITDLHNGRMYVQVQSERAPDGNLWGWLLK